jgi:hypothetical protein
LNGQAIYLKLPPVAGVSKLVAALALAAAAAPLTDAALRPQVDRLVAAVAAARHLPYVGTLPARAVTREESTRTVRVTIGEAMQNRALRTEAELLRRLHVQPGEGAADASAAEAYGDPAAARARYDAASKYLLVPDFIPWDAQRTEVAHEIAHAITDQHFGLRRLLAIAPDGTSPLDGDARRARLALIEGDAMLAGLELADPREGFLGPHAIVALAARLRAAAEADQPTRPSGLVEFTHVDGLLFVAGVRAHRPFSAVDALWADPPASSEQVLHPEKYDACEAPIAVDEAVLPTLPGYGRPAGSDVLGEIVIRTWLASVLPSEIAERAATGWGGDRAAFYLPASGAGVGDAGAGATCGPLACTTPLAWITIWDDPGEADDFARAASQVLATMSVPLPPDWAERTVNDGDRAEFPSTHGTFAVARRGDAVVLLLDAPEPAGATLDAMLDAVRPRATRKATPRPRRAAQPGCPRRDRAAGPP